MKSSTFVMGTTTANRTRLGQLAKGLAGALAIITAAPLVAGATTLVTPLVQSQGGTFITCVATNGGTSPAHVVVKAYDLDGNVVSVSLCGTGDLAPGQSCYAYVGNNTPGACSFDAQGKIRAAAELIDIATSQVLTAISATK